MTRYQSDVIVIGAGIAGIAAAIELLERGRRVLVLDRDLKANLGGLAKQSFGGFWFADTEIQRRRGIDDSAESGLRDWLSFAQFSEEDVWPRKWAELYVNRSIDDIYNWLKPRGIRFFPVPHWVERGEFGDGNSLPRYHIVWGTDSA